MASEKIKPVRYSFKSSGIDSTSRIITKERVDQIVLKPIGIKTPLELTYNDSESLFKTHNNIEDVIQDNLRNLLLTNKGERLGRFDFGASLRSVTFEMMSSENFEQFLMNEILESVNKYLPYIELENFSSEMFNFEPNSIKGIATLIINISYSVSSLSIKEKTLALKLQIGG
jgi:phage baseplate assembly protein W